MPSALAHTSRAVIVLLLLPLAGTRIEAVHLDKEPIQPRTRDALAGEPRLLSKLSERVELYTVECATQCRVV